MSGESIIQGGQALGEQIEIGTLDNWPFVIKTGGAPRIQVNNVDSPFPGALYMGTDIDDDYPVQDIFYGRRDFGDQLLFTLANKYNVPGDAAGSGFVCVTDRGDTASISAQNSNWDVDLDGTFPNEATFVGFGIPCAILTQDRPTGTHVTKIDIRPNEITVARFDAPGGVKKIGLNGADPVAQGVITGSRASGAALANLLAFLAARGDIVDSTTP